ncbi:hypothetical protein RhiirA1_484232 [Rhizophagus irregularis]|uniref:Uncharacterized protein n=1 Tax=Rhizophagus irregularis TaxID=588596 RepID=A0A2N0QJK2_9GLOM|nr:hypothetical protein RhiirA1_484232 [Rhizophagus irregularis]
METYVEEKPILYSYDGKKNYRNRKDKLLKDWIVQLTLWIRIVWGSCAYFW